MNIDLRHRTPVVVPLFLALTLGLFASCGRDGRRAASADRPEGAAPAGVSGRAAQPAPRPHAAADAAFLAAYADAFDRILARLEKLAPDVAPPRDAEGLVPLDARIDGLLTRIEQRCAEPGGPPAAEVARLDELQTELSVLRRRLADAEKAREKERNRRREVERRLSVVEAEASGAKARAGELAALSEAFVLAATSGELRALVRADVLRRRLGLRSDYEMTARALPVGATGRTITAVDPAAKVIYLGPKVTAAKIVSSHRGYSELYAIERRDGQLAIVLRDPVTFWRIGRYLIVQVEG